ncbi:hypothetical protein I5677_07045 [Mobilitalea sibirica]|uniref:Uncharacterized protein n=1 Tax=Mobilitalea sibirica TaxID=1462919 RepID=A0A8J7KST7_9FIRM|nr:hypothetical protein [Mobilitalea sibirica]MBH1940641.1 hypothetical protein [Mobilitalea sibirica]
MDDFEHIVDLAIVIILIFLFPLLFFGQKQDAIVQTVVEKEASQFVDEIRSKGYVTKEMYDEYVNQLSKTGLLYDVSLEHRQLIYEPEYRFRTPEEVIDEQDAAYTGTNTYHYRSVTTNVPHVEDPVFNGNLNTETNESVMEDAEDTPALPGHIHADDCYNGTKHTHNSSCDSTYYSTWKHVESQSSSERHSGCNGYISYYSSVDVCAECGVYFQYSQTSCSGSCGTFEYSSGYSGNCTCSGYYVYSCGKEEGKYYNGDTEVSPNCNEKVTELTPTHPTQTVYTNDPLITTAKATYMDGSTKTVLCNTTYVTSSVVENRPVTITYSYSIDGTTYSKEATITVNVIPRNKECDHGHLYNLNTDERDPGCPYCRAWLSNLTVVIPDTGRITIYRGTTLPDNGVTLLATYLDGRTEYVYSDYVDNLDEYYVGSQNVTLSYKGHYTHLYVTTKRNIVFCSECGRYYELHPDDSNPGCPFCQSKIPIFTGNVMEYIDKRYTYEILKELYEGSGTYYFTDRDYLLLSLENKSASWGRRLLTNIFRGLDEKYIDFSYGGYVRENGR